MTVWQACRGSGYNAAGIACHWPSEKNFWPYHALLLFTTTSMIPNTCRTDSQWAFVTDANRGGML